MLSRQAQRSPAVASTTLLSLSVSTLHALMRVYLSVSLLVHHAVASFDAYTATATNGGLSTCDCLHQTTSITAKATAPNVGWGRSGTSPQSFVVPSPGGDATSAAPDCGSAVGGLAIRLASSNQQDYLMVGVHNASHALEAVTKTRSDGSTYKDPRLTFGMYIRGGDFAQWHDGGWARPSDAPGRLTPWAEGDTFAIRLEECSGGGCSMTFYHNGVRQPFVKTGIPPGTRFVAGLIGSMDQSTSATPHRLELSWLCAAAPASPPPVSSGLILKGDGKAINFDHVSIQPDGASLRVHPKGTEPSRSADVCVRMHVEDGLVPGGVRDTCLLTLQAQLTSQTAQLAALAALAAAPPSRRIALP